jgi:hypothetical protein
MPLKELVRRRAQLVVDGELLHARRERVLRGAHAHLAGPTLERIAHELGAVEEQIAAIDAELDLEDPTRRDMLARWELAEIDEELERRHDRAQERHERSARNLRRFEARRVLWARLDGTLLNRVRPVARSREPRRRTAGVAAARRRGPPSSHRRSSSSDDDEFARDLLEAVRR